MNLDLHKSFQQMIDESLAAGITPEQERSLGEHLQVCITCQQYLSASQGVIESLGGFSFEVDPAVHARVLASLEIAARQIQSARLSPRQWVLLSVAALVLTLGGSLIDLQLGSVIASVFNLQHLQLRQHLLAFWIVPSLWIFLMFPLLPYLLKAGVDRKERNL